MKKITVLLGMVTCLLAGSVMADEQWQTNQLVSKHFKQVVERLHKHYGSKMLVVFDDDNTLETTDKSNGYLGGVAWYDWQSSLLKKNPHSKQLMAHSIGELLNIQRFLFDAVPMKPTEPGVVRMVRQFESEGVPVLVETARGPEMAPETQAAFQQSHLQFNYHAKQTLPTFKPSMQLCYVKTAGRSASFDKGIYYVSGQDKGAMLGCLFSRFHQRPDAIVFADDAPVDGQQVYDFFTYHYPDIHIYTVVDNHLKKAVQQFDAKAKQQAWKQWRKLKPKYEQWKNSFTSTA